MADRPIRDLPVVTDEYDVLQFPVDQNNVAKRVYATDLAQEFSNTVILENTISDMDLSVSMTAEEIYTLAKDGQIVLFDSGFLESNSTVSCLFPIHRVEKNGNDYTAFVYVRNDIDDPIYEYAIDKFGGVNLIGESSGGGSVSGAVLYSEEQDLTEEQKALARQNIGAAAPGEGGGGNVGVLSETHNANGAVTLFLSGGDGTLIASENNGNITLMVG